MKSSNDPRRTLRPEELAGEIEAGIPMLLGEEAVRNTRSLRARIWERGVVGPTIPRSLSTNSRPKTRGMTRNLRDLIPTWTKSNQSMLRNESPPTCSPRRTRRTSLTQVTKSRPDQSTRTSNTLARRIKGLLLRTAWFKNEIQLTTSWTRCRTKLSPKPRSQSTKRSWTCLECSPIRSPHLATSDRLKSPGSSPIPVSPAAKMSTIETWRPRQTML
jgi:hypothetical protein